MIQTSYHTPAAPTDDPGEKSIMKDDRRCQIAEQMAYMPGTPPPGQIWTQTLTYSSCY